MRVRPLFFNQNISKMKLRPLQEVAVEKCCEFINSKIKGNKHDAGLCVCPTGFGKSLVIAEIVKRYKDEKILILQPSKELLEQNFDKLNIVAPEINAAIYSASLNTKEVSRVTFATLGSIVRQTHLFSRCTIIIIDECHLYPTSDESMFGGFLSKLPNTKIVGMTATPFRLKSFGTREYNYSKIQMLDKVRPSLFKKWIHIVQIKDNIHFWAKLEYATLSTQMDLKVNSTGADYTESSLKKETAKLHPDILDYCSSDKYKHILVFVSSIEAAKKLSESANNAAFVCGETPKKEREAIIAKFKTGQIKTVFNVGVLTTGFDFPELDCIILARPTMSVALYYQMIGRGVRQHISKEKCTVIDMVNMVERFGKIEDLVIEKRGTAMNLYNGFTQISNRDIAEIGVIEEITENNIDMIGFVDMKIDFGKHSGKKISEIAKEDKRYLVWAVENLSGRKSLIKEIKFYLGYMESDKYKELVLQDTDGQSSLF